MKEKFTLADKLNAIKLYEEYFRCCDIASLIGCQKSLISTWIMRYNKRGVKGLELMSNQSKEYFLRVKALRDVIEKSLPFRKVTVKYRVSVRSVERWSKLANAGGYKALKYNKQHNKQSEAMGKPRKKEPQTELENFRAENEWLKMKNVLLKKLKALAEERDAKLSALVHKPSKD